MDEKYIVPCIINGRSVDAVLEIEDADCCKIRLKAEDITLFSEDDNYFYALIKLRKELEPKGIKLLCLGCARNVFPSPMILDMGDAIRAYKLTMGKQAKMADLVCIFDPCKLEDYATIEEQEAFYEAWIKSEKD